MTQFLVNFGFDSVCTVFFMPLLPLVMPFIVSIYFHCLVKLLQTGMECFFGADSNISEEFRESFWKIAQEALGGVEFFPDGTLLEFGGREPQ